MDAYPRHLEPKASRFLANFPILAILGSRQSGKTTLAQRLAPNWRYMDLENPSDADRLYDDPLLFFRENPKHVVIDEAQRAPKLFEILRGVVDAKREATGRFILTGSGSFELVRQISETLAGRIGLIELSPMTMAEKERLSLSPFFNLLEQPITKNALRDLRSLKPRRSESSVRQHLLEGGYPEPSLRQDEDFRLDWLENYIRTYIQRDVRDMFPGLDLVRYRRVLAMLSQLSGTIINRSEIARSVETSEKTVRDYLDIIRGTFFWRSLDAYPTTKLKTALKLPKGHFTDSAVGLFLQNIHTSEQLDVHHALGRTFEAFIVEELLRGAAATSTHNLRGYHFRTKAGAEVDLILEGSFGTLPIEIKHASNVRPKQVRGLTNFIDTHDLPFGIVFCRCERPDPITEKIIQLPVTCL